MKRPNPTMVKAGRKSWLTRRANEKKRTMEEAGRKSWITRRANEKKAKIQTVSLSEIDQLLKKQGYRLTITKAI